MVRIKAIRIGLENVGYGIEKLARNLEQIKCDVLTV